MIKVSKVEVSGLANALYGMRLPKNSNWKSDTECLVYDLGLKKTITVGINDLALDTQKIIDVKIGDEDRRLSTTLVKAGKTHSKWIREVQISMLVNAPLYWWKEFDQYKVGTTTNSESTMHTITQKEFTKDMFSFEKTLGFKNEIKQYEPKIDYEKEIWKEYPLNKIYLVSNMGRVFRKGYTATNGNFYKERLLTNTLTKDKYLKVGIYIDGVKKDVRVHRVVAQTFLPNEDPKKIEVNHIDGNKLNNHVDNLEWTTSSENQQHAILNGLQPVKNINNRYNKSELSKEKIDEISKSNKSATELSIEYGVDVGYIYAIKSGTYNYFDEPIEVQDTLDDLVALLNSLRNAYLEAKSPLTKKRIWDTIIQILPSSWNQARMVTFSLQTASGMYFDRKNHKLSEWVDFCEELSNLPTVGEFITLE